MALLFMDGFGGGETTKWSIGSTSYNPNSSNPRVAGCYSSGGGSNGRLLNKNVAASNKIFIGAGWYPGTNSGSISVFGDSGTVQHISVVRNTTTGLVEIRRGTETGTLLATGTTNLYPNRWSYIEVSVTISDTVGEVHVRLNGSPTDEVSFVGDTKNGGSSTDIDKIRFDFNLNWYISDVYILNDTGPAPNNNFLGDVAVRTLSPNGNGTYSQLVGSDGNSTDNYQLVDERPFSVTDYVGSATVGDKDTYVVEDLPSGITTVYGIQLCGLMAKSDATNANARLLLRSGGTDFNGITQTLSTSYLGYYEVYQANPATSAAWTPAGVNGVEIGMEVM